MCLCFLRFNFRVFSSKVLTPKCHLLLLTVFCDRKVFPKAMKGFKSRGEESWKLAQGYSTKVPLVRFPIACDVRGNRGSPSLLLPFKDIQRTYCWPIENAKITMLTFFQQNPLWSILDTKYQKIEDFWKSNFRSFLRWGIDIYANEPFRRWISDIYSLLFLTYDILSLQFPNVLYLLKTLSRGLFYGSDCNFFCISEAIKNCCSFSVCMPNSFQPNGSHRFSIGLICVKERW